METKPNKSKSYPGGKRGSGVYQTVINQMPPHPEYIELFLGHGGIMRAKRPALHSVGIDPDSDVIAFWKAGLLYGAVGEIPGLEIIQGDAMDFLRSYKPASPDSLVYADPPYLGCTRKSSAPIYKHEFRTPAEHAELLKVLKELPCNVMISGYDSALYRKVLKSWRVVRYMAQTRGGMVQESLWMNYPEPTQLHDYTFLGDNYREREKINRQIKRWCNRLGNMNPLQYFAMMAAIQRHNEQRTKPTR